MVLDSGNVIAHLSLFYSSVLIAHIKQTTFLHRLVISAVPFPLREDKSQLDINVPVDQSSTVNQPADLFRHRPRGAFAPPAPFLQIAATPRRLFSLTLVRPKSRRSRRGPHPAGTHVLPRKALQPSPGLHRAGKNTRFGVGHQSKQGRSLGAQRGSQEPHQPRRTRCAPARTMGSHRPSPL